MAETLAPLRQRSVLIAGLGNIGSTLPALLARAGVGRLRLVDRDRVEDRNLAAQDYRADDVGKPKAAVVAARLKEQFPSVTVEAHCAELEDLPRGLAAVDLVLGALDSRLARQTLVSDLAWPLGVPVIDGGVGEPLLGRVQVFLGREDAACLECTWGAADYRLASAEYPCRPGMPAQGVPTGAPAHLGAFVAAIMAGEAVRLLSGPAPSESYEIACDLDGPHLRRFALRRSPRCRHDHGIVRETVRVSGTVGEMLEALATRFGAQPVRLEVRRALGGFWAPEGLRPYAGEALRQRGLVAGDRIRAVSKDAVVWLEVVA
jgi:molybdopterin/thiamine biosynthesis adenylyltransferase